MRLELSQERLWQEPERKRAVLLADARGWPAHLGAVMLARGLPPPPPLRGCSAEHRAQVDGRIYWTSMAVPPQVLSQFADRRDNQIGGLELLSPA